MFLQLLSHPSHLVFAMELALGTWLFQYDISELYDPRLRTSFQIAFLE